MISFDAIYLKANDPITKRALWIREQRMGGRVWRWAVLTDPVWAAPKVWTPECDLTEVLHWDDPGKPLRLLPAWMYWIPFTIKYESLHWNGRISGQLVILNAVKNLALDPSPAAQDDKLVWDLTHWPAQQGHLWGRRISREWAWGHGNCFLEDPTAAFEILTSGGCTVLSLHSQVLNFTANTMRTWRCTHHEITPTSWNWEFAHDDLKITGQFCLGYAKMVALDYPTPQGGLRTCHNTKVGEGVIEVVRAGRPLLQLTAHDTLAWEYVRTGV